MEKETITYIVGVMVFAITAWVVIISLVPSAQQVNASTSEILTIVVPENFGKVIMITHDRGAIVILFENGMFVPSWIQEDIPYLIVWESS